MLCSRALRHRSGAAVEPERVPLETGIARPFSFVAS